MLAYAATPVCLALALLADGPQSVCGGMSSGSLFGGMATMYLVMAALHAGPWLRLLPKGLIMKDL